MTWPFALTLKNIALSGREREIARARHELFGEELDRKLLELEHANRDSKEYRVAILDIDKKYSKISELAYQKEKHTLNDLPWVGYKDYGLEEQDGKTGFWFEFDWNDAFVEKLRSEGYEGIDDEDVVRRWYGELCRVVALEEGLALDIFDDLDADGAAPIKKRRNSDGTVDYS